MSYGLCEAETESLETELVQANAEGVTILNSAGDTGAAACDTVPPNNAFNPPFDPAEFGLAVNYPASSPEVTGVGGTSIPSPTYYTSTYWNSNGTSTVDFGASALTTLIGHEVGWNDDEALGQYCVENPGSPGSFCDPSPGVDVTLAQTFQEDYWISIGGGGVSNCLDETLGGICISGFPQPTWQQSLSIPGLTSPQSTYRYVPDVSLIASPNFPGYIICTPIENLLTTSPYDTETTSSCGSGGASGIQTAADGVVVGEIFVVDPSIIGGTSASSPIFAGIVTLLNQYLGGTGLGNINSQLYSMAGNPFYSAFHHVTSGDNNVYCQPGTPAGNPTDVICPASGVIGFSAANFDSTTGYNLVTGLGSVDANALATDWADSLITTTTSVSPSSNSISIGASVTFTATVTPSSATGVVKFYNNGSTTAIGSGSVSGGTATLTTTTLPAGTNSIVGTYNGINAASTSSPVTVNVAAPFTLSASPATFTLPAGQTATSTITVTPVNGFTGTVNFNPSGSPVGGCTSGLPAGAACSFSQGGSVILNGSSAQTLILTITTAANMALGTQAITVTGTTGTTLVPTTINLTETATNQSFTITPSAATYSVAAGNPASVGITVTGMNGFIVTSSNTTALPLTYSCTGLPSEASCSFSPSQGEAVSATTLTLSIATTAPTAQLRPPFGRGSRVFYALLLPGLFGIVFAGGRRTRAVRLLGLILVLGFSTLWLSSCSGGSSSSQNNPGTPAGSYPITVNATTTSTPPGGTALTGSFTVTLTVTQ